MNESIAESFRDFEHRGWESAFRQYESSFASLTAQAIPHVLRALALRAGARLLDVACGPGHLAGAAAATLGDDCVLGIDFSAQMVESALRNYPNLAFQSGDAENLTAIGDSTFEFVAMNFGIMHLGEPERALREFHRVLKPGGRAAFTVWRPPSEAKSFEVIRQAIAEFGDPAIPLPSAPDMFHYSEPANCVEALGRCGFTQPAVETFAQTWKLICPAELFAAYLNGTARTGGLMQRQTPEQLERIRVSVEERASGMIHDGKVTIPMPAMVAWGCKQ